LDHKRFWHKIITGSVGSAFFCFSCPYLFGKLLAMHLYEHEKLEQGKQHGEANQNTAAIRPSRDSHQTL
jgi:hypothetical protein